MITASRLTLLGSLVLAQVAHADSQDEIAALRPPGYAEPEPGPLQSEVIPHARTPALQTDTPRWGGGIRLTGLSGIGALPGVNFGGEVAGHLRRDEYFVELALGRWKPEDTYLVADTSERIELGLDVWTLRGGWSSMTMPLRAWALVEVGEVAGGHGMPGVVSRMVMGDTPQKNQWRAAGAGFGVAWPMSNHARLVGNMEIAVPIKRERLMLERGEAYEPDPLAARYSVGLEVGWR
jgi:hypothetical protein